MEEGAELTHGNEEIRRKQDDQQAARQGNMARPQLRGRQNDAQRRAAIGDDVHDADGVELHGQYLHGDFAELFGLLVHLPLLEAVGLIDFERRQALQVLKKRIAQRGILPPVLGEQLLCPRLHSRSRHGNQRHADQQRHGAGHIDEAQARKQRQRRQHGVKELRQIGAEIGLQLIRALHGHLHDLGSRRLLPVGDAQAQQLPIDALAQRALDRAAGEIAHPRRAYGAQKANGQRQAGGHHRRHHMGRCVREQCRQQ